IKGCAAGRVIAAKADANDSSTGGIEVPPGLEIVQCSAARHVVVESKGEAPESDAFTISGSIDNQRADPPPGKLEGSAGQAHFLGDVETVEVDDHRRLRDAFCVNQVRGHEG